MLNTDWNSEEEKLNINDTFEEIFRMHKKIKVPQSLYTIEECSELIKALTDLIKSLIKKERNKENEEEIIDECCDVLNTVILLLKEMGVSKEEIKQHMVLKLERALKRFEKGEI